MSQISFENLDPLFMITKSKDFDSLSQNILYLPTNIKKKEDLIEFINKFFS